MFTRLFNNIGPRSLVNAASLCLLLAAFYWWTPFNQVIWYPKSEWNWPLMSGGVFFISLLLLSLIFAFGFSEWQNGLHNFSPNYFYWIYFFLGSFFLYFLWPYSTHLFALPFLFLIITLCYKAILPNQDLAKLNFLIAFSIALISFFEKEAPYLVSIPFLLGLFVGGLNLRSFLAMILGYGAVLYFAISVDFLFNTSLMELLWTNLGSLEINWPTLEGNSLYSLPAIGIHLTLSILISFSGIARYNNEQKRILGFWLLLLVLAVFAFLSLGHKGLWASLALFPYVFFASRATQSLDNKWLREGMALWPIVIYLLAVFL